MHALRVLEFNKICERLASKCETQVAARMALELVPSFDDDQVWRLQALTAEAYELVGSRTLPSLSSVDDFEQAVLRASKGGTIEASTLWRIGRALSAMRALRTLVESTKDQAKGLWEFASRLPSLPKLEGKLEASLDSGGEVLSSASAELAKIRRQRMQLTQRITERIQSYVSGKNRDYLSDPIYTQRDGRYVIPVKAEHKSKIRGIVHDTSATGQTVFLEPEDVLQAGNQLRECESMERAEVARILAELSSDVGANAEEIVIGGGAAAEIDLILAKARLGYEMNANLPLRLKKAACITIRKGLHPELDPVNAVPLSIEVGAEFDCVLITGPNTGGKTVAIKAVGLFVCMAQCGMMLPASEVSLGTFSQIWADIGDEQSLQQSLSTFSGHIKNIANALRDLKLGALVLFDEIGAGTDPAEGAALAKSLLIEFQRRGAKVLASTHYGELKVFATNAPRFVNASMEFDLKTLRPTYRLMMGTPGASHALQIAQRCGIPEDVVQRASADTGIAQQEIAKMLEKLEHSKRQAERAQSEADRLANRLRQVEAEAEKKLAEAAEARRTAKSKVVEALEQELREIRLEAAEIFEELKGGGSVEAAREKLRDIQQRGDEFAAQFREPAPKATTEVEISRGMNVKIDGQGAVGVVVSDPKNGKANVQLGPIKMEFALNRLVPVSVPSQARQAKRDVRLRGSGSVPMELHVRSMRAEEMQGELERFIDDAILAGLPYVRIVHGKGEGILRSITRSYLKSHRGVKSFRDGGEGEGGHGVTVAVLT